MLILFLYIFSFHFGDGTVALLLNAANHNSYSTDFNSPRHNEDGMVAIKFLLDVIDRFINVNEVLALNRF